jgi:predicted amidohydrolase YtcJ
VNAPAWRATERVLLVNGSVYSPVSPFATAMLIDGDRVAWLGEDSAAAAHRDSADRVVDLRGSLVTPGFVDAHVHATSTGITLTGLDLSRTTSLAEALALLEARARDLRGATILGHGWDETRWPEARPPSRDEVDRATWGSVVYLSRIDVHSAVVSSALVAQVPGVRELAGWDATGPLSQHAHHAVREATLGMIGAGQRAAAHRVTRERAASLGIVSMHEMAGPTISSEDDLAELLATAATEPGPTVIGYWGQLAREGGIERARALGAVGVAGDLFVDGAIGSRTACLCQPYADAPGSSGAGYLDANEIADHVTAATEAGVQAGFHVIGDAASDAVVQGLRAAGERVGLPAMRAAMHRLEHAELLTDDHVGALAELGVIASMQPMFDALWGGPGGMYEQRLGAERAAGMNRFADLVSAGVLVAFGSDAPVTELGPWAAVRGAVHPTNPGQALSTRAAFGAHTRSGWRAVGHPDTGTLAPDAPAHLAIWAVEDIVVQAPDERVAAWSTDPRSGTPGLPALGPDLPLPTCLRTIVHGRTVFDSGDLDQP